MNKIHQFALKHQTILKIYLATIAASASFDLVAINTAFGNLKLVYFLCLPLLGLIDSTELKSFFKKHLYKIMIFSLSLLATTFFSYDKTSSIKWIIQLFLNLYLYIAIYNAFKLLNNMEDLIPTAVLLILLPGLMQWLYIQLGFEPPFLSQTHGIFYRLNGFSFYPNFFTVAISLFLPILLLKEKFVVSERIVIFLAGFLLLQSTSRTGILALILLIIAKTLIPLKINKQKVIDLVPIFLAIILSLSLPEKTINESKVSGADKLSFFANEMKLAPAVSPLERIYIAKQGLKVFLDHPILGVGPLAYEKFIKNLDLNLQKRYFSETMRGALYESHENIWIELLANNGLIFTIITISIISYFLIKNFTFKLDYKNSTVLCLILYYAINGQFVQNILYPPTFVIWAFLSYCIFNENKHHHSNI